MPRLAIEQPTNRRTAPEGGHRCHTRSDRTIAHLDIVTSLLDTVCGIARAVVHGDGADSSLPALGYRPSRFSILS
jgi:hypothetical protein